MVSSSFALPAAAWLVMLLDVSSAVMIPAALAPRQTQESSSSSSSSASPSPTQSVQSTSALTANPSPSVTNAIDPWVTVDESGKPKTITPVLTTISGTPTIISGAPYQVTGTVFTQTGADAKITTSTGPAQPQATNADGSGAFAVCRNTDGAFAPFCEPKNNSTLHPGATHYVTWDPSFFKTERNTTVRVVGFYNANDTDEAFSSDIFPAGWGFYQWSVNSELYAKRHRSGVNITLRIAALPAGGERTWIPGPTVLVAPSQTPLPKPATLPTGPALYIGLPTILGFVILVVAGTCIWNRRARQIGLGNIMSRGRDGYGVGKSRRQRIIGKGGKNKDQAIRLMDRDEETRGRPMYRDEPSPAARGGDDDTWRREPMVGHHALGSPQRRDSDALGSLAGSPTKENFSGGGGNVFRDEMNRQQRTRDRPF